MDLFAEAMENKNVGEDLPTNEEKEYYQYITHTDFKVDDRIKAEIPNYGIWQKKNKNLIMKSSVKGTVGIDTIYNELQEAYPTVFATYLDAETTHPGDQFKKMVNAARKIQEKMYVAEGDAGTELQGLDMDTISHLWADEMSKALSITKPEKKASATKKTAKSTTKTEDKKNESKDKQRADEKVAGSKKTEEGIRKNKSRPDGNSTESNQKGYSESSDTVNEGRTDTEEKISVHKKIINSIPTLDKIPNVATLDGTEISPHGKIVDRLMDFVNKNGDTVHRDGFGDILFSKSRIKNSMIGHGTGNTKIETFAAIPEVLKHGIEIDSQNNWKGRSYDTYIFAAPVNYKNEKVYVGAIVQKDSQSNRYYLHEVVTNDALLEEIKKEALTSESDRTSALTGDLDTVSDAKASITNITESTRKSNNNSEKPTELKARGRKKQNTQPPNKDNPLQGSLHNIVPRKNYGKTDAAIDSITEGNRATAENIGSIIKDIGKTFKVNIYAKRFRNRGNTLGWFNNTHNEIHTQEQEQLGVAIHELGHKIDSETKLNESQSVQDMLDGIPGLKEELKLS